MYTWKYSGAHCIIPGWLSFFANNFRPFFLASKELIDEQEYSRALHVVNETEYTKAFMKHLQNREYKEAGQAMFNSHSSLR